MTLTKNEKLNIAILRARNLKDQGRYSESFLAYEKVIESLTSKKKQKPKDDEL